MPFSLQVTDFLARRMLDRMIRDLPPGILRLSERRALQSFRRAASSISAYKTILRQRGVDPEQIRTLADFHQRVPLCRKHMLFGEFDMKALAVRGRLNGAGAVFTSSGHSGEFSFGLETRSEAEASRVAVDALLDRYFRVSSTRTLLVNLLPGGVRVPSRHVLTADLGPRIDASLAMIRQMAPHCEQVLIVTEPLLLKALVETGVQSGLEWSRHRIHVVTGGELMPENLRTYVGQLLGHDEARPEQGQILMSFGVSEIALSLAHETPELRQIRRLLHRNPALRQQVFGKVAFAPGLLAYFPTLHYIESPMVDGRPSLVVTTLSERRSIPLVRYDTGDWVKRLTADQLVRALRNAGIRGAPKSHLPVLAAFGRGRALRVLDACVYPEQLKEAFYADAEIAACGTGQLFLEAEGERCRLRVQLQRGRTARPDFARRFESLLRDWCPVEISVSWEEHESFGRGMTLDYQRKHSSL